MSDPLDQLARFDGGDPAAPPLPAAEVRRRGDRLRRRNTVLAGVGAALAVAVIATPIAVLTSGSDSTEPEPAPAPTSPSVTTDTLVSGEVLAEIPDSVDLTADMPANESGEPVTATTDGDGVVDLQFCAEQAFPLRDDLVDRLAATAIGPEYASARELRVYGSTEQATAAVDQVVDAAEGCPREDLGEELGNTTWVHAVTPTDLGEASYTVQRTFEDQGAPSIGATWWQVVRVGNAVLATATSGEYAPGPILEDATTDDVEALRPLVDQLCPFSADGCPTPDATGTPGEVPLTSGWPEAGGDYSLEGPGTSVEPFVYRACGAELPTSAVTGYLRTRLSGPEDLRTRELQTFRTVRGAVEAVDAFVAFYEACPQQSSDGVEVGHEFRPSDLGDQSATVVALRADESGGRRSASRCSSRSASVARW